MKNLDTLVVTGEFRALVKALASRLGGVHVVAASRWQPLADQFDVGAADSDEARQLIVGPPAVVLKHAATATTDEFGFVMPVAQMARWWQRSARWRDDATLELWKAGWSPVTIDRLLVPTHDATIEFVIGSARPTPAVALDGTLALDDSDRIDHDGVAGTGHRYEI